MKFIDFKNEYNKKLYTSNFQEAKRQFYFSFATKIEKEDFLNQLAGLDPKKKYMKSEKIIINNITCFLDEYEENLITIIYKIKDNFYRKEFSIKNGKLYYKELIKMKKSPWGIERQFIKRMLKVDFKKTKSRILKVLDN